MNSAISDAWLKKTSATSMRSGTLAGSLNARLTTVAKSTDCLAVQCYYCINRHWRCSQYTHT
ncbi:Uncharacterised protein [Mycobacteroides abscessus subsp. massiliense]|nr:Uncharacterised protein [Mycobacteroides abscessus subsp. massiliense]